MKKTFLSLLIIVCACVFCLCACSDPEPALPEKGADFSYISIINRGGGVFDISCDFLEGATYYVTTEENYGENDIVEIDSQNGTTSFTTTVTLSDAKDRSVYIWRCYKDKEVYERVYIPDTDLYVYLNDNGSADIFYNYNNLTTISSYYSSKGKSLYKASKAVFDFATAEVVAIDLSLASESDSDNAFSFNKPYYYASFTSRDGRVTYISQGAQETTTLVQYAYASFAKNEDNKPILHVDARAVENEIDYTYRLVVRQENGQTLNALNTGSNTKLSFDLELSPLKAEGIWYDVFIEIVETGTVYDLDAGLSKGTALECGRTTYEFKEYYGALKINFRTERLDTSSTDAELKMVNSKPTLIVRTALLNGATKDNVDAHLEVRYQPSSGSKIVVDSVYDSSSDPSIMEFCFDLSKMTVAGNWHDIVIVIDGSDSEIMATDINTSQQLTSGGKTFCFKVWEGILKITY